MTSRILSGMFLVAMTASAAQAGGEKLVRPPVPEAESPPGPEGALAAARPGDDKLSCTEIRAEGDRELAIVTQASTDMGKIEVSNAPAKAAAAASVGLATLNAIVGVVGGGVAGAIAGKGAEAVTIGSSKAAQLAMTAEYDKKADEIEGRYRTAENRWSYLVQLYQSKCQ